MFKRERIYIYGNMRIKKKSNNKEEEYKKIEKFCKKDKDYTINIIYSVKIKIKKR